MTRRVVPGTATLANLAQPYLIVASEHETKNDTLCTEMR